MAYNNVFTLRKNQFLIFMCISALLLSGCKRHAAKTITMDIDTVQVKEIRISGMGLCHYSVLVQNKQGGCYEIKDDYVYDVIGSVQRGDWLVIDANPENHPWNYTSRTFRVYENLTTGNVDQWYARNIRPSVRNGQDTIRFIKKNAKPLPPSRCVVLVRNRGK